MSAWKRDTKRFTSVEIPIASVGGLSDEKWNALLRFENGKLYFLALAFLFAVLAFLAAMLHVDDSKGVVLEFKSFLTARGGLALGFLVLAGWTVYLARPTMRIVGEPNAKK